MKLSAGPSVLHYMYVHVWAHHADVFQIAVVGCPGQYTLGRLFFEKEKKDKEKDLRDIFFRHMEHYGSKNFKMLLLLQIAFKIFQTSPEFSSQ